MAAPTANSPGSQEFSEQILPPSSQPGPLPTWAQDSLAHLGLVGVVGSSTSSGKPPLIASGRVKCLLRTSLGLYTQNKTDSPPGPTGRLLLRTFQNKVGHWGLFLFKKEFYHPKEFELCGKEHGLGSQTVRVCKCAKSFQSCPTPRNPMDCSPPGSSIHGILQARILEWVARPSSRESS